VIQWLEPLLRRHFCYVWENERLHVSNLTPAL
jgi:hypothetical protein